MCKGYIKGPDQLAKLDAREKKEYILGYWSPIVSNEKKLAIVEVNSVMTGLVKKRFFCGSKEKISGFYAEYDEGVFAVFFDKEDSFIFWNSDVVNLKDIRKTNLDSTFLGREFRAYDKNGRIILGVKYKTLWRGLLNPIKFAGDLLVDDWGLVADLPGFINSSGSNSELRDRLDKLLSRFKKDGY